MERAYYAPRVSAGADEKVLDRFSPAVSEWFRSRHRAPTRVQALGWPRIAAGEHVLLCAPTGSGKTLAAFLACLDRLGSRPRPAPTTQIVYVSPLKALAYDIERNLEIGRASCREGEAIWAAPA